MNLDAYFRHLDEQEATAKRLAFEESEACRDSYVPKWAIAVGIFGLLVILSLVPHLEVLL